MQSLPTAHISTQGAERVPLDEALMLQAGLGVICMQDRQLAGILNASSSAPTVKFKDGRVLFTFNLPKDAPHDMVSRVTCALRQRVADSDMDLFVESVGEGVQSAYSGITQHGGLQLQVSLAPWLAAQVKDAYNDLQQWYRRGWQQQCG